MGNDEKWILFEGEFGIEEKRRRGRSEERQLSKSPRRVRRYNYEQRFGLAPLSLFMMMICSILDAVFILVN